MMLHQASTKVVVVAFQSRILPIRTLSLPRSWHRFSITLNQLPTYSYCYNNKPILHFKTSFPTSTREPSYKPTLPHWSTSRLNFNRRINFNISRSMDSTLSQIILLTTTLYWNIKTPFFPFYISYISFIYIPTEHGDHASLCIALAIKQSKQS